MTVMVDDEYLTGLEKWRAEMDTNLRRENDRLALAGLFWLQKGFNTFGSSQDCDILLPKPAPRIIGYGTKIVIRTVDTPNGPVEYWRAYAMYATSYAAKYLGGSSRTASGMTLTKGIVAIDRRYIPFFTRMYVPGYGLAVAGDIGGGVKGRWIDLGFDDWNYESWHKSVMVYFLTPVPPANQITWIIPSTVP